MASSFTSQIGFLAGDTTGKTNEIAQYLKEGVEDVIAKVKTLKPNEMPLFSKEVGIPNGGYELADNGIILDVQLNGMICRNIQTKHRFDVFDPDSMYYAHTLSPVFWVINGKVYVAPYGEQASSAPSDAEVDSCLISKKGVGSKEKSQKTEQKTGVSEKSKSKGAEKTVSS
tara:strand:+ start:9309 stop:9821 length:513 start_codon:yes stop_codon:yes gene_type:complete